MNHPTPLFPEIAEAEGVTPPPFVPFIAFPRDAMYDDNLDRADLRVLAVIIDDCNGLLEGRRWRKRESYLSNEEIGERGSVHPKAVSRCLKKLAEHGQLKRFEDKLSRGNPRCLQLAFRTTGDPDRGPKPADRSSRINTRGLAPALTGVSAGANPGLARALPPGSARATAPCIGTGASEEIREEFKTSKEDVTCVRTGKTGTGKDVPPPPAAEAPPGPGEVRALAAALGLGSRRGRAAVRTGSSSPPALAAPPVPPPPPPPPPPVPRPRPSARPSTGPATGPPAPPGTVPGSTAIDGAWARLMARAAPDAAPQTGHAPPAPLSPGIRNSVPDSGASVPPVARPGVGPVTISDPAALARALDRAGPSAAAELAGVLAARWRDDKPETVAFWASALAEVGSGLLSADLVAGLVKDADRKQVRHKARQFSRAIGQALTDARGAKKPPAGSRSNFPGGRPKSLAPDVPNLT